MINPLRYDSVKRAAMAGTVTARRGIVLLALGTIVAGSIGWVAAEQNDDKASDRESNRPGRMIELTQCPIKLVDEVILSCDRPGIVAYVKPREGDTVHDGDLVVGLDDEVAVAALATATKEAESDVDIRYSEKSSEVARAEYEKALETNRRGKVIPEVEVNRLKLAWEKTTLELESAKHRHAVSQLKRDEAQAQLNTFRIKAPFDGFVTRVYRSKGEAVKQGDQVLELVRTSHVRVDGLVSIGEVLHIRRGDEVDVRLDIPEADLEIEKQSFRGKIVFVDVKAEPVSRKIRIGAEVENPDNILRAGLRARMTVHLRDGQ
jgi:RND family efflux transporter MFP subunit